ncbi:MAG TPA: hypothetical protein VMV39_07225, partial [Terracidiphilus sp.]|nr:hypothetical protein [Terracidiphilus sp.]
TMTLNRLVVPAIAIFLGATGLGAVHASALPLGQPLSAYAQDRGGWDTPPQEFQETQRRGFHDGIEGARKDFDNHRRPDVNNRDEYRDPRVPRDQREAYRDGFRRGYEQGVSHLMGGDQQQSGQPEQHMREPGRDSHENFPGMGMEQGSDIQRRGFHDGMDGARKDMDNHRRPNVNNRDEYRHPNVPRQVRNEYREAFRRGYEQAMSHQMGEHDRH